MHGRRRARRAGGSREGGAPWWTRCRVLKVGEPSLAARPWSGVGSERAGIDASTARIHRPFDREGHSKNRRAVGGWGGRRGSLRRNSARYRSGGCGDTVGHPRRFGPDVHLCKHPGWLFSENHDTTPPGQREAFFRSSNAPGISATPRRRRGDPREHQGTVVESVTGWLHPPSGGRYNVGTDVHGGGPGNGPPADRCAWGSASDASEDLSLVFVIAKVGCGS